MRINIWCLILMYQHYLSYIPCQSPSNNQFSPLARNIFASTPAFWSPFLRAKKKIQGTLLVPSKSIRKFSPSSLCSTWGQSSWKAVGLGFEKHLSKSRCDTDMVPPLLIQSVTDWGQTWRKLRPKDMVQTVQIHHSNILMMVQKSC